MGEKHVLLVPYPSQGHINPMLQFAKRLASHGLRTSLAITRYIANSTQPEPGPVSVESISDGFDRDGSRGASSVEEYLTRLESAGSETLTGLIESLRSRGNPVQVLVYDAFLPWAFDVANRFGLRTASFFTQACVVDAIYWQVWEGRLKYPVTEPVELAPGLPRFEPRDLPSFLSDPDPGPYPAYLEMVVNQYKNLEKADVVLINSIYELEPEVSFFILFLNFF